MMLVVGLVHGNRGCWQEYIGVTLWRATPTAGEVVVFRLSKILCPLCPEGIVCWKRRGWVWQAASRSSLGTSWCQLGIKFFKDCDYLQSWRGCRTMRTENWVQNFTIFWYSFKSLVQHRSGMFQGTVVIYIVFRINCLLSRCSHCDNVDIWSILRGRFRGNIAIFDHYCLSWSYCGPKVADIQIFGISKNVSTCVYPIHSFWAYLQASAWPGEMTNLYQASNIEVWQLFCQKTFFWWWNNVYSWAKSRAEVDPPTDRWCTKYEPDWPILLRTMNDYRFFAF